MTTRRAMLWSMLWIVLAWVIAVTLPTGVAEGQPLDPIEALGAGPEAVGAVGAVEGVGGIDGEASQSERRAEAYDPLNPISVLSRASQALPAGQGTDLSAGALGPDATAGERGGLSTTISIVLLLTVLSLAPAILVMCTSFTRIIVVLALLRQALGTQTLPPSQVIVGLSLFLTMLVMAPTFERINTEALQPLQDPNSWMTEMEAWERAKQPLRDFMFAQIEHAGNWDAVYMILNYRQIDTSEPGQLRRSDVDMLTLVPAFVLSELKVAFLLGFQLYLPFLVIDMVVSSVLISMGMLMLPPVLISLPFKLLLFVMVDGWNLVAGNLLNSFAVPGVTT
ncbi:MAG: flagellar type III secretion system pore protein FliP [Planctomycetota bacterium]